MTPSVAQNPYSVFFHIVDSVAMASSSLIWIPRPDVPTNTVVTMQEEKSQHKNKAKAMKILRARIYEQQRASLHASRAADRKSQVGTGDRSERIRTYNFPQGRVSDHRINLTLYKIERVMQGELDEFIDALTAEDQAARLAAEV